MCLKFGGSNQIQLKSYPREFTGENLHPIISNHSNSKTKVTLQQYVFVFSYSKRPFRRHHHRSRVCRHTTWPYQYTWAWHWTRPLDRQICFPDKWWPYNCSRLFHQYNPYSRRSASGPEYIGGSHNGTGHCGTEGNLK